MQVERRRSLTSNRRRGTFRVHFGAEPGRRDQPVRFPGRCPTLHEIESQHHRRTDLPHGASARLNHTAAVTSVEFSPYGTTLASGSGDVTFGNSGDDTVRLWTVANGREEATLEGHTSGVRSVSFSPDGRTLASGGDVPQRACVG